MRFDYDIHIHTNLSSCAPAEATVESYIRYAEEHGLRAIGIANHMWDSVVPGASGWYAPQSFEHIAGIKEQIACAKHSMPIYFGCETEYVHDGTLAISEAVAEKLDYILVPHSHTHMNEVLPRAIYDTDEKHAAQLVRSFLSLVQHPMSWRFAAIAHPFSPGTNYGKYNDILSHITDGQFRECVLAAKEKGIGLELNVSVILPFLDSEGVFHGEISRFFSIVKECGWKITWGSDAHGVYDLKLPQVYRFLESCGLCENDVMTIDEILKRNRK